MARPAAHPAPLLLALSLGTFGACNGQVLEFMPRDAGTDANPELVALSSPTGAPLRTSGVRKLDILLDIDNSASMGDKQAYFNAAVVELVQRLINPNCVNPATMASSGPSLDGLCQNAGERPELPPVHDMHIGVISSSLGPRGGNACMATATAPSPFSNVPAHDDDQAHLLDRTLTYSPAGSSSPTSVAEGTVTDAPVTDPFLYWYPTSNTMPAGPGHAVTDPSMLVTDVTALVGGAGVYGCGIESQLESWYRFLIQPDPYASITVSGGKASWTDVDSTLLQQRHDFLRPDSAVLIVVLSDENDSEIDVRSLGQVGYSWMDGAFQPPRGTSVCTTSPGSSSCQSCAQTGAPSSDPSCKQGPYVALNDWGFDLNLRHVHMKQKYGVDVQFPIQRYVNGLTSTTVPDRCGEYGGCLGNVFSAYGGVNDCQNPLFAGQLPDGTNLGMNTLCHAPPGPRTKDQVFYAHIGGVPNALLHFDPTSALKSLLTPADWVKILGNDPEHYDTTGIDPHMVEDYRPRQGIAGPGSANGADPISGREWVTDTSNGTPGSGAPGGHILPVDRQYACIFPLSDAAGNPTPRDCTLPENASACDCPHAAGGLTAQELPPVCDPMTPTQQVAAKAYPTIRELLLAKLMGSQGIVSSICPLHVADNATGDDPLFGYRPAVAAIVDRLKRVLDAPCFPEALKVNSDGTVPCLVLLQLTQQHGGSCLKPDCTQSPGLLVPESQVLSAFCASAEAQFQQEVAQTGGSTTGLTDPAAIAVCELNQLTPSMNPVAYQGGSCANALAPTDQGWCYVTGAAAGTCSQQVVFTQKSLPPGAQPWLHCGQ